MPLPASLFQGRYTRQQIANAVGIASDLLAYWIREGLLIAAEGEGLGKGKHRFFGFEAVHIAAVLKELGRYGVQTAGLKQVASLLWGVFAFGSKHPDITESDMLRAAYLRRARAKYPARASLAQGEEEASREDYGSFEDWLEHHTDTTEKAFEIEPWLDEKAQLRFALYFDLFAENVFDQEHTRWMFFHEDDQLIAVPEEFYTGPYDLENVPSYIMVDLSLIIKPLWML
ncbi:MerR family transcriptional regulator [Novosphingobium pentaromativorans]|uniref:Uncharacterized protein n=1 Tax=Novosphingobium pentaromativorans US6-1 TaxID=1088721 RepID=G6E9F7_9SPHN|nr:MerR family transcriptional regulator [Novosphingobium pentaromativorans]AIT81034.1 hypothetical protein JI59_15230 [Novosphingobium pentaromativorans US6-1]EHJ62056.1 hypothetical protein NSU_0978 [Novosphingobium pentaromativorans US6-1]